MNAPTRRYTMSKLGWTTAVPIGVVMLTILGLATFGVAQANRGGVAWLTSLASARQAAAAQGRPILVHFWDDNCPPCMAVERKVFSRPEVQRAISTGFIPVKIKVSDAPDVARWLKIDRWPVDVVLSPEGKELARSVSPQDSQAYLTMLGQAAPAANSAQAKTPPTNTMSSALPISGSGHLPAGAVAQAGSVEVAPDFRMPVGPQPAPLATALAQPAAAAAAGGNPPLGMDGFCVVSLAEKLDWRRGDVRWGVVHRDRTYLFAGPDEQRKFLENPDRYAPMLSGYDPVIFAERGQLVPGQRRHGAWLKQQVYLFADEGSLERFRSNPLAYAQNAERAMRGASAGR